MTNHGLRRIKAAYLAGLSAPETARRLGLKTNMVRYWARKLELRFAPAMPRYGPVNPLAYSHLDRTMKSLAFWLDKHDGG